MRLGLFSMPLHPPERPIADTYDDDMETFQLAEELGYDEVWIGEHFTSTWENIPSPDLFIADAAARTKRVKFGTGVVLMPFHNPLMVALRLAQLDHQTRGRLMVGVGSGGLLMDKKTFGIDPTPEQAGRLTWEGIELLTRFWQGEPVQFEGEFFKADVGPPREDISSGYLMKPYQLPHPPIALAGVTRGSYGLGRAGENGWLPLSTNFLPPADLVGHWASYAAGCARASRPADRGVWRIGRDVHVADTTELARKQVRDGAHGAAYSRYMLPLVGSGRGLAPFKVDEAMTDADVTIDYLIDNVWIVGSPNDVAAKLRALQSQTGGFGTLLQVAIDWAPDKAIWHRSMELLAKQVLPRLS